MNIVIKTLELLKLSYSEDLQTAFDAECEIFENFDKMTPQEMDEYRKQAKDHWEGVQANNLAEQHKTQNLYENGMSHI